MNAPKKVLLCRTDRLGDVILALPCAVLIKRMFPDCRVGFLTREYTAPIVELCSSVDEIIRLDNVFTRRDISIALENTDYDTAVVLFPDAKVAKALFFARIPQRSGTAYRWCSIYFNRRHREHRKYNLKHEAEYNLSLTFAAFNRHGKWTDYISPEELFPLDFRFPESVKTEVEKLLSDLDSSGRTLVAIHPGGSGSAHRWEADKYALLAQYLAEEKRFALIITGSQGEQELCQQVERSVTGTVLNLCGKLSLPELAETYRHCRLLVTNSTGPLHLGRAVGTMVLGLFPRDPGMSPVRWGPYGMPQCVLQPPEGAPLHRLDPDTVFKKVLALIEQ